MSKLKIKHIPEGWVILNNEGQTHIKPYATQRLAQVASNKMEGGLIKFEAQVGQYVHMY